MKFPIDVKSTVKRYDGDDLFQSYLNLFLPLVNDCYRDGRDGKPFLFDDEQLTVEGWSKATGHPVTPWARKALGRMIQFCRKAYTAGCCSETVKFSDI